MVGRTMFIHWTFQTFPMCQQPTSPDSCKSINMNRHTVLKTYEKKLNITNSLETKTQQQKKGEL